MKYKILTLLILIFLGISKVPAQFKQDVSTIDYSKLSINGITISKSIIDSIQTQTKKKFELLKFYHWRDSIIDTTNYGYWDTISNGIVIKGLDPDIANYILDKYSELLSSEDNFIYLTNLVIKEIFLIKNHYKTKRFVDFAIIKAKNQYEAIKIVGTESLNYDISNQKIIDKLKYWDSSMGLKIWYMDQNRIESKILNLPKNLKKLAKEIDEFSPDAKKHYGSLEVMIENCLKQNELLLLWE